MFVFENIITRLQKARKIKISIVAILFATMLFSCRQNSMEEVKALTTDEKIPAIAAKEVNMLYSEEAKIRVIVKAPVMNQYREEEKAYKEMPEGIDVKFYDSTDKVSSSIRSNYAIDYETELKMEAKNDVVVVNEKQEQLNTEHLIWDRKAEKIYTDEFVKITTPDKIFFGEGMESDQRFENWKLKKVKGTFSVDANRNTDSTSSTNN